MYFTVDKLEYFKFTNAIGQDQFYALYAASKYQSGVSFNELTGNITVISDGQSRYGLVTVSEKGQLVSCFKFCSSPSHDADLFLAGSRVLCAYCTLSNG